MIFLQKELEKSTDPADVKIVDKKEKGLKT
jgi:hypothetical protein